MCIIVYKPHNKKIPNKNLFKQCWDNNQDGAGIAVYNKKTEEWEVTKGFMTWKRFWKHFSSLELKKSDTFVCHFRVGTSGRIDEGNTHPFLITDNIDKMRQVKFKSKNIAIHNGVVATLYGTVESDTMQWIQKYVYTLHPYIWDDKKIKDLSDELFKSKNNRWFITKGRSIMLYGEWQKDKQGIMYSNKYYKEAKPFSVKNTGTIQQTQVTYIDTKKNQTTHSAMFGTHAKDILKKSEENKYNDKKTTVETGFISNSTGFKPGKKSTAHVDENGEIIWDNPTDENIIPLSCPNCFEDKQFALSDFNVGDTICQTCGAVFDDNTGAIFTFDQNVWNK